MMDDADMMHGGDWHGEDLAGWLVGEKLHGCRVFWDGSRLWTRGGCEVRIPHGWAEALPGARLDGELWAGYGGFKTAMLATNYGRFTPAVRLMVFDVDGPGGFAERQDAARRLVDGLDFAEIVTHVPCPSTAAAIERMRDVQAAGGEGLIARYPGNRYRPGRTREILKLKLAAIA